MPFELGSSFAFVQAFDPTQNTPRKQKTEKRARACAAVVPGCEVAMDERKLSEVRFIRARWGGARVK